MASANLPKAIIIDGHSLLYRAFFALPPLTTRSGEQTNALYGFTGMLYRLLEEEKPDHVVVALDPPGPSFRVDLDPAYKAQRPSMPPELAQQLQRIRQILAAMRIAVFEEAGFEADDVIATLADRFVAAGARVMVVSGDADLLQLVGEQVGVMLTKKGISQVEPYDIARLREEYGLHPGQVIDYKALRGDPSDNIPGVPGIGAKTARRLIEAYGNIEGIYENLAEIKGRAGTNLVQYREQLLKGRELVSLRRDVPLACDIEQCRFLEPDAEILRPLFKELEFRRFLERLPGPTESSSGASTEPSSSSPEVAELVTPADLKGLINELPAGADLALLALGPPGRPSWRRPATLLALAAGGRQGHYLNLENFGPQGREAWATLADACRAGHALLTHDYKQCCHFFLAAGQPVPAAAFDTYLAAYLLEPTRGDYDLSYLFTHHLHSPPPEAVLPQEGEELSGAGRALAARAAALYLLRESLAAGLEEQNLNSLLTDLEQPLAAVLARMERRGISVDQNCLQELSRANTARLAQLEEQIQELAGTSFNLNSPRQLAEVLFDRLHLPVLRKTKTGRSTDARVLEELAEQHEIAALLLHYRRLSKLESTYLSGLAELVDGETGRLYTTFNQAATATGRLSSSEPNLQNIPVRLEEGRRIRRAFVTSRPDALLIAADYSQVELRILAHLSGDPILVEAFQTDQDIHRRTAAEVNGVPLEEVTPRQRELAKAVNFGIIYGSSDYGLAQNLRIPRAEAAAYLDSYFARYQGVRAYMDSIIARAREVGYVTTLLNRRRYLPELRSPNANTRGFAERMALNTPIQGSAADIIKLAMLRVEEALGRTDLSAELLLQIHDELLFEIPASEREDFAALVCREMEGAFKLAVPLRVDLKWGLSWEELKSY